MGTPICKRKKMATRNVQHNYHEYHINQDEPPLEYQFNDDVTTMRGVATNSRIMIGTSNCNHGSIGVEREPGQNSVRVLRMPMNKVANVFQHCNDSHGLLGVGAFAVLVASAVAMMWLATSMCKEPQGCFGMRTITSDFVRRKQPRREL